MSDIAAWISAGAAVVSVIAAIWASCKGAKAQEASHRLRARLAEIEEAREKDRLVHDLKADLGAEILSENIGSGRAYRLRVDNSGRAEARNIVIVMDAKPILGHPAIPGNQSEIQTVGPGASFQYPLSITRGCCPPFSIEISWQDDSGTPGLFKTTLSL